MPKRYRFPTTRPEPFYGPEDHMEGMEVAEEEDSAERRMAAWDEGYRRLRWFEKLLFAFCMPIRTRFEVRLDGPEPGVYDQREAG